MDEWIKNLWEKNKFFFFLLLPLILILVFRDLILGLLIGSARKLGQETQKKDDQLKTEQQKAEDAAAAHKAAADELAKKIQDGKVDEDWNKHL